MKLINKTAYDTATIRKLLTIVHEHMAIREGRLSDWGRGQDTIEITITYSRGGNACSGTAWDHESRCTLRLHRPNTPMVGKSVREDHHGGRSTYRDFVWLSYHEMMHLYGYDHRQFKDIPNDEIAMLLSANGYTLTSELPITLSEENTMKVKISGTSFAAVDLTGVPGVTEQKEVKRGKGVVVVIEVSPEGAAEIVKRLQAKDTAESGISYEAKYACRIDAKKIDKQLSQASEAQPEAPAAAPAAQA